MKKWLGVAVAILIIGGGVYGYLLNRKLINPLGNKKAAIELKLEKYDFDSLKKRGGVASEIMIGGEPKEVNLRRKQKIAFESKTFSYESEGKKITGLINIPSEVDSRLRGNDKHVVKLPVVIMIRGYADREGYYPGFGSWRVADELAKNGWMTVSMDFLGFGDSEGESTDMLEARFEKVTAVLDLIESVKKLSYVDQNKISIWAHSNGGQIAISVLEITGGNYKTTLWAPMTNPFPQSVLDTAPDLDDGGIAVKSAIENFQRNYDVRRYAIDSYYSWIKAPIKIAQGTGDVQVKLGWQQELKSQLEKLGKSVVLEVYPGDDHNLSRNWEKVVARDVEWLRK